MMLRLLSITTFCLWILGCTQTPVHTDSTHSNSNSTKATSTTITEGWNAVVPKQWQIHCTVELILNRSQNLKTSLQTEFEGSRNSNGKDQFRFTTLSQPAYTLLSYQTGFLSHTSHTDVRTQITQASEKAQGIQAAQTALKEFEQKIGFEAKHEKNENIPFLQEEGQFSFERGFDGSVQNIQQNMNTRYLYQKPEDSPPDFNPNIFPALEQILSFLSDPPLKSSKLKTILAFQKGYEWSTTSNDFLQKFADTTIAINPKLSFMLNRYQKKELIWKWKVIEQTEDLLKTRAEVDPFSLELQDYDFSLSSFSRNVTFHRKHHFIEDDHFEAVFKGKEAPQEIRLEIRLQAKS